MSTSDGKRGTKRKVESMYPVSFAEFKNMVTNLPDICFELQSEKGAITLDDCAMFFYKQFYENPSIREKYPVYIKPCPRHKKMKFFSIPTVPESGAPPSKVKARETSNASTRTVCEEAPPWMVSLPAPETSSATTETVCERSPPLIEALPAPASRSAKSMALPEMVALPGCAGAVSETTDGPASKNATRTRSPSMESINFDEFAEDVLVNIRNAGKFIFPMPRNLFMKYLNKETVLNACIPNKVKETMPVAEQLLTVYNEFYIFPFKRKEVEYFVGLPKDLKKHIFRYGKPRDLNAETTVQTSCPIVPFTVFEDHIFNLNDIVARIQSEDRSGKSWKWAEYSQAYYFAFYLNVKIREKYNFEIKDCPKRMKDRLLRIPNKATAEFLRKRMPQNLPQINPNVSTTPLPEHLQEPAKKDIADKQITFGLFKRFIKNLDEVVLQMQACEKYKNKSEKECAKIMYKELYSNPEFHKTFECKWKPCPARISKILLSFSKSIPRQSEKEMDAAPVKNGIQILEELELDPIPGNVLEKWVNNCELTKGKAPAKENESWAKLKIPKTITFSLFARLIQNLDSIILQMKQSARYKNTSDVECAKKFYKSYFSCPKFRKLFVCKWKPCPGKIRELLSRYEEEGKENRPETNNNNLDYDVVEDLGFGLFKMPVSFDKFCHCINIDDIVAKLMKTSDKKVIRADLNKYTSHCTDIYTQFFLFPHYRQKISYQVKTTDAQFRKQLEKYAVPMDEKAKSSMAKHSLKSHLVNLKGVVYKFPVPLETFIQYVSNDLLVSLIKDAAPTASSKRVAEIQGDQRRCNRLLRGFYHSFYTSREERDRFLWSFNDAPPEVLEKMHEYAVPIFCQAEDVPIERVVEQINHSDLQRNPPISYQIFEFFVDLEVVIKKMEEDPAYAHETDDKCKKIFYREFYNNPRVRLKYPYQIKPCPIDLIKKILMIPEPNKISSSQARNSSDLKALYAARRMELYSKTLENVRYNLSAHVLHGNYHIPDKPSSVSNEADEPFPEDNGLSEPPASPTNSGQDPSAREEIEMEVSPKIDPVGEALLKEAKETFFAESNLEHNLRYLICTTIGLKRHMWRLLYQLTLEEFRSYTNIHGGELLYTSEMDLKQCYEHVVIMGNWPLNLYVSLSKLRHLLHSKGVAMETLDLSQISPKIMHWNELVQHTDFDQIVELQYTDRTGKKFSDQKTLWQERKQFYADCWRHDEWIYQVPKISDGRLNEMPLGDIPPSVDFVWRPVFGCENAATSASDTREGDKVTSPGNKETLIAPLNQIALSEDHTYSKQNASNSGEMDNECASTQIDNNSGADTESEPYSLYSVCSSETTVVEQYPPVTTPSETNTPQLDPVVEPPMIEIPAVLVVPEPERTEAQETEPTASALNESNFVDVNSVCPATQMDPEFIDPLIKQEPIHFLNNLRAAFSDNSVSECQWESISSEQIICLDSDEEVDLACFAIPTSANTPNPSSVDPTEGRKNEEVLAQKDAFVTRRKRVPKNNQQPAKRPRLAKDNVPQLRHGFRPLPLSTTDRTETVASGDPEAVNSTPLEQAPPPLPLQIALVPEDQRTPASQEGNVTQTAPRITASQDFAMGNSFFESSQMQRLMNNITVRKVIAENSNTDTVVSGPQPVDATSLWSHVVFRQLELYRFFESLTLEDIINKQIEGYMVGATYQEALFKFDKRVSHARGPILETLFPQLSTMLQGDVRHVLRDMKHFEYNSRYPGFKNPNLDLRERVLSLLMDVAPSFGMFHFQFDNASRVWATCSKDGRGDVDPVKRRSEFSVTDIISPDVLEGMRELNDPDFIL
ncbi:protein telomere ends associated isoform X3 [Drosophila ananassae]|uniref:protein telomere ends associated isoform X3 n=1 Tax=Drosophila ananassae TaxID=7217 RepID=UPI0013A5EE0B|nr:protein telomere ends associated isoform X3 [Drosophila ananassae]